MNTPGAVLNLRKALDEAEIDWAPVRDYPHATYLPEPNLFYTIWWQGPTILEYLWGHQFEYHDSTVEAVLARLEQLRGKTDA